MRAVGEAPTPMKAPSSQTVLQAVAIVCIVGLLAMIGHKAVADVSLVWDQHSGLDFWKALARYLLRNLAGG